MSSKSTANKYQNYRLDKIEGHISTLNKEMGCVKTDLAWLKWWMKLIIGITFTGLIIGLLNLAIK